MFWWFLKKKFLTKWLCYNFHAWMYDKLFLSKMLNLFLRTRKLQNRQLDQKYSLKIFITLKILYEFSLISIFSIYFIYETVWLAFFFNACQPGWFKNKLKYFSDRQNYFDKRFQIPRSLINLSHEKILEFSLDGLIFAWMPCGYLFNAIFPQGALSGYSCAVTISPR